MNTDPGIIGFTHCKKLIFCTQLPDVCPLCQQPLIDNQLLPFRIPYPFVRARQSLCAIIVKPSVGNFLNCYSVNSDLHIGITSSTGDVFEFDSNGLSTNNTDAWNQSLVVYQLKDFAWYRHWDNILKSIYDQLKSSPKTYDENSHNCYSFVLLFVREFRHADFEKKAQSKEIFCQNFIIAPLKDAYHLF